MLSIYIITVGHPKDEKFYSSLADDNLDLLLDDPDIELSRRLERLQKGSVKVDPFEEIRCSSCRRQFYQHHQSNGFLRMHVRLMTRTGEQQTLCSVLQRVFLC